MILRIDQGSLRSGKNRKSENMLEELLTAVLREMEEYLPGPLEEDLEYIM